MDPELLYKKSLENKNPITMSLKTKLEIMTYVQQIKKIQEILYLLRKILILHET